MTNTKLLEWYIERSGFKKKYLAKKLKLSPYGLTKKIRGENEFKASEINLLCDLLKINTLEERQNIFFARSVDFESTLTNYKEVDNELP